MQDTITSLLGQYGYGGVFFLIAVENIFPPIPSEVILTFSGFLTTLTDLTLWGVIAAATFGSIVGAAVLYSAGRLLSPARLGAVLNGRIGKLLHLEYADVAKAAVWFTTRGWPCVLYCRCIPIVRSLISIPAGMAGMRLAPFFLLTTIGSLIWNILLVHLGAWAGQNWSAVSLLLAQSSVGVRSLLIGVAGLAAAGWLYKCARRNYNRTS